MGKIHAGATLTPHFREFLPAWVAAQPWCAAPPEALRPTGFFRFEDPAGEVGVETHLLHDGQDVYQVPLTYRAAPLAGGALVARAEHSVLGTRWIHDAVSDPVWIAAVLDLVARNGVSDSASRGPIGPAEARGRVLRPVPFTPETITIDLDRRIVRDEPGDAAGVVTGSWHHEGVIATGRLAVLRQTGPNT